MFEDTFSLDEAQSNLYYSVATSENSTLQEFRHRRTLIQNEDSFFKRVSNIAGRYNLPGPEEM